MRPHIFIPTDKFTRDARKIMAVTGQSAGEVVRQWGRVFITYCLKFTPPTGKHPVRESLPSQRKRGERNVVGDLAKLFFSASTSPLAKDEKIGPYFRKYVRQGNIQALETMAMKLTGERRYILGGSHGELLTTHKANRNSRGRVRGRRNPVMVLNAGSLAAYVKEIKTHVGRAKAGWWKAFTALGANLTGTEWISRHTEPGLFQDLSSKRPRHEIIVGNGIVYGGAFDAGRIFNGAFTQLSRSMRKSARIIEAHLKRAGATVKS